MTSQTPAVPLTVLLVAIIGLLVTCGPTSHAPASAPNRQPATASALAASSQAAAPVIVQVPAPTPPSAVPAADAGAPAVADAGGDASLAALSSAFVPPPPRCPPAAPVAGFSHCRAVDVTGSLPCELLCERPRRAKQTKCCKDPVDVVIMSGKRQLLRVAACSFVPPDCAHSHGHGNMSSELRFLDAPPPTPPDIIVVEGGCEMRAVAHGYVPAGVAAWIGCRHERYRWDGKRLRLVERH